MPDKPSPQVETNVDGPTASGAEAETATRAKQADAPDEARAGEPARAVGDEGPAGFDDEGKFGSWMREVLRQTPSWLVSMVIHIVVLLALALLTLPPAVLDQTAQLLVAPSDDEELVEITDLDDAPLEAISTEISDAVFESTFEQDTVDTSPFDDMEAAAVSVELDVGLDRAPKSDLLHKIGAFSGGALDGRGAGKGRLVASRGGTGASEAAVALALKWFAEHQLPDGSWSFDHTQCPKCRGQCRNPGHPQARNGATGMALLPFLGAGQTHKDGEYKDRIRAGLYFLVNNMRVDQKGGSLMDAGGNMYSHGIAAIALCEAYAMTQDKGLYVPAQQALNFIAYAQDQIGGGWRYQPRTPGDTSVVGWQVMALKSGHMAYLRVPPITVQKAYRFLDSVQANNGAHYGYTDPAAGREGTTSVGLLCRMYLGWKRDHPALQQGVKWISDRGPSTNNMYYNYYATQVMSHWEGELWKKWNPVMRDQLVKSQAKQGHEAGSWYMEAGHVTDKGGRLYCTSMATMILEVYYRHLPIYQKQSTEEDFPLD